MELQNICTDGEHLGRSIYVRLVDALILKELWTYVATALNTTLSTDIIRYTNLLLSPISLNALHSLVTMSYRWSLSATYKGHLVMKCISSSMALRLQYLQIRSSAGMLYLDPDSFSRGCAEIRKSLRYAKFLRSRYDSL